MAGRRLAPGFVFAHGVVKTVAIVGGLSATVVSLMAVFGAFTENGWGRLASALVIAFAVPLVLVDRLLPDDDPQRAAGLPTDVCALIWVGFPLVFVTLGHGASAGLLAREGERLDRSGMRDVARVAYLLAGARPVAHAAVADTARRHPVAHDDAGAVAVAPADAAAAATDAGAAARRPRPERTPAEIFRDWAPSVVTVHVHADHDREGGGTGFLIDAQGTIATNSHVVHRAERVSVKLFDNTRVDDVELLVDNEHADLALIRVRTNARLVPVVLGDSDAVVVGERAVSIGNPLGLEHTLTDGLVSARRIWEGRPMIQMSVPVSPGNSGGPVFNMRGEVIGITTAQLGGLFGRAQNLNLAVPVNVLKTMIRPNYPERRRFGRDANAPNRW